MLEASQVQSQMASSLIESVLGQAQSKQTDLAMKMARISLQTQLQSPPGTAGVNGQGGMVDVVG